jgi:hypothetical protein
LSLCFNWAPRHEGVLGEWRYSSTHSLTSALDRVVSFTPRPLYPQGKSPWYSLDRRLVGPHSRSGRGSEEKNSQLPPGIESYNPDRSARSPALYRLSYHGSFVIVNIPKNVSPLKQQMTTHFPIESHYFVHRDIRWTVGKVQYVSDRMSLITSVGSWWDIIVLNVQGPREDKSHDTTGGLYDKLERVFDQFQSYSTFSNR